MARKSRKNMPAAVAGTSGNLTAQAVMDLKQEVKPYQAAVYLQGYRIAEFVDDGFSGADFTRPNFQKMMELVKAGDIAVIITKDYSRLGRDYLEVGNYMECIFPLMQVRYISVNDGYDSRQNFGSTGGMDVVLKNIVNAMYCRDASRKVRSAKKTLAQQGKYIAAFAPFG